LKCQRYGYGTGILTVYLQIEGYGTIPMWQLSGEQGDDWFQGRVGFSGSLDHSILIESRLTLTTHGDMGLDDISIKPGYCPTIPTFADPSPGLTTPTQPTTPKAFVHQHDTLNHANRSIVSRLERRLPMHHQHLTVISRRTRVLHGVLLPNQS
jgi:hypothetical protein